MGKLDFNKNIKGLDNQPIDDSNMGKLLATKLANSNKGDAMKFTCWAIDLYGGKTIDLDKSDQKTLRDFIEGHSELTNIAKMRLFEVLDNKKS